ncbi:MAG TPA: TadE/TadG family type IV pilus assembly protein [Sphingomicrobium sp.]|nr:TadE/TadG family type IV pilus assembly protein [Sphingomicrobium sp.]
MIGRRISRDERGAAIVEFALSVPILITFIWGVFQLSLVFEADAGMQQALGEAARNATIYPTPTDATIKSKITAKKFGVQNGTWAEPSIVDGGDGSKLITVSYSQPLDFLFFEGPDVTLTRSKKVFLSK